MGMFDYAKCDYPLPWPEAKDFGFEWQTKSTDRHMDRYEVRDDGTLWYEEHDIEDQSDPGLPGLLGMAGCMTPVNQRRVQIQWNGEFEIHHIFGGQWYSVTFWLKDGVVKDFIANKRPVGGGVPVATVYKTE